MMNRVKLLCCAAILLLVTLLPLAHSRTAQAAPPSQSDAPDVRGPFVGDSVLPTVWNGDLRDLPQLPEDSSLGEPKEQPRLRTPQEAGGHSTTGADPLAQQRVEGGGTMPPPIANFAGLNFQQFGAGWPPDTNGDVGINHYIQTVNTSVGIFDKATGTRLVGVSFNTFFQGPAGTPCDNANAGDPVALYDARADRWLVTDFAWFNFNTGPFYQCIAISQTGDPVSGGWYFYALRADTDDLAGFLNDYPKLGIWQDGYYMTANMFQIQAPYGFAVRVWALDRDSMLSGGPLNEVHFDTCTEGINCDSLLAANMGFSDPPPDAPEYFMAAVAPDELLLWEFDVDWDTPSNSTFTLTSELEVAPFEIVDYAIPQQGSPEELDSLSARLMTQLHYRNRGDYESIWVSHTVDNDGLAATRWYEVRDPGGDPYLYQQGTYSPDDHHHWMSSIASDQDGNAAVGFSVSSEEMYPAIRYAGRRNGEVLGQMTQSEASLIEGTGAQNGGFGRWGDYSYMSVDPTDDCTFWYTTEYYITTGNNWQTRIGSFKFPACGQELGTIAGTVTNAVTGEPVAGVPVQVTGVEESLVALTDESGYFSLDVLPGSYDVTAGPLQPGYPEAVSVNDQTVTANATTTVNLALNPVPYLDYAQATVDDSGAGGNGNGYPEPGESNLELSIGVANTGGITSTAITGELFSLTPGVTVTQEMASYPDIAAGEVAFNSDPFVFSIDPMLPCGSDLSFRLDLTTSDESYTLYFHLMASVPQEPEVYFFDDFESGAPGWTTGGSPNLWGLTTTHYNSPTHSYTDSPNGDYPDNANNWLISPALDLSDKDGVTISAAYSYELEAGYDYVYLEYSEDGGATWNTDPLEQFNGFTKKGGWVERTTDASILDGLSNVKVRYRLESDSGVHFDGLYVDDFSVSYTPIVCEAVPPTAIELDSLSSTSGTPFRYALGLLGLSITACAAVALRRRTA